MISFIENNEHRKSKRRLQQTLGVTLVLLLLLFSEFLAVIGNPQTVYAQSAMPATSNVAAITAIVGAQSAVLQAVPGGETVQPLAPGVALTAIGRNADDQWVQIETSDGVTGWIKTATLILFGISQLPVVDVTVVASESQPIIVATVPTTITAPLSSTIAVSGVDATASLVDATASVTDTTSTSSTLEIVDQGAVITATVTATGARLNVRSGPGTDYPVLAKVTTGQILTVQARNEAADWLQIALTDDQWGWVAAPYVQLSTAASQLPLSVPINEAVAAVTPAQVISVLDENESTQTAAALPVTVDEGNADSLAVATVPVVVEQAVPAVASGSTAQGLAGTLVFASDNGGAIYVYDLASGALRQLTSGYDPAISPDGSQVAFTRDGGESGLYLINIDGSNERKIFGERATLRSPKWSPDGKWIVFSQVPDSYQCYELGPQCLTRTDLKQQFPNLAQDPDALDKFVADLDIVSKDLWTLARVDVDGQEYRDIAALDSARTPDWSTTGIVYQSSAGLQITADVTDAENKVVLAEHYVQDPDWQPNGGRIVYQSRRGSHWEIFAVNADGSGQTALTRPETTLVDQLPSNVSPTWSPDGQSIVFLSNREENNEAGAWRIWVMNADGSNQRPLPIDVTIEYTYTGEQMISWGG